jgi:hypothetical protein
MSRIERSNGLAQTTRHPSLRKLCFALQEKARFAMARANGKTALITGSTDGVGRVVAERLGQDGWRVLVHGRDRARGEQVVSAINAGGGHTYRYGGAHDRSNSHHRTIRAFCRVSRISGVGSDGTQLTHAHAKYG